MTTKIEWTQGDDGALGETWNPLSGCTPISPGCAHCYAATMARRLEAMGNAKYAGTAERRGSTDVFTGRINFDHDALSIPLRWKKPRRVFVNSMSDLFHADVPFEFVDRVFAVMALAHQHTFQVLTKRPERMAEYFDARQQEGGISRDVYVEGEAQKLWHGRTGSDPSMWLAVHFPLPNVWLGTSVEDQKRADERIPRLRRCPAAVRFLSCEPLLGPVDLSPWLSQLGWTICGGESGTNARPMHPDWARSLRDQCVAAGVPFFFKQWGEWLPMDEAGPWCEGRPTVNLWPKQENCPTTLPTTMFRVGKKAAGALLDGREWRQFPEVRA